MKHTDGCRGNLSHDPSELLNPSSLSSSVFEGVLYGSVCFFLPLMFLEGLVARLLIECVSRNYAIFC